MNAAARKKLFAYAIPVDLVVVATGVGLLVPRILPLAIIGVYVAAVAFSAWKSGWIGALAATILSAVLLFVLFNRTVEELIGWFLAASVLVSIPLVAWGTRARHRKRSGEANDDLPPYVPMIAMPRSIEETAAAAIIGEDDIVAREAHARAEGERVAAERFAVEKKRLDDEFTRARTQVERELTARFEQRRTELHAAYERERVTLKTKFDAARQEIEAERAELRKQVEEARRGPAAVETHIDEEAIAQRLEHLRAELQQQFERELRTSVEMELAAQRQMLERDSQREIEKVRHGAEERIAAMRAELDAALARQAAMAAEAQLQVQLPRPAPPAPPLQRGIFSSFFNRGSKPQLKLNRAAVSGESTATRRAAAVAVAESSATRRANAARVAVERKGRILFLESRRATADTAAPRLRQLGIEIVIVERLVDAVDEIYRFRPDVIFLDAGIHDFDKAYKTISGLARNLPIVLTSRNASSIPDVGRADIAVRPYDIDEVVELTHAAVNDPQALLARQGRTRADAPPAVITPAPKVDAAPVAREGYDIVCANCRIAFDAVEADWCSCLTRDRTVVCTNCLTCFCKAAPAYQETFWMNAPPRLFERRAAELRRQSLGIAANLPPDEVKRPLVMLVEDDEEIQALMQRVCANLRYGSISATNGQDGLELARLYRPNLILADAFLPKLDGREMCRLLKLDPIFGDTKMVVMTGLYTDTRYKAEAIERFGIDDYLAKPVSITDLINLLQRHLEGVLDLPAQENLYELHRKEFDAGLMADRKAYEVACITCGDMFDAAKASWCRHPDNTLVCEHCGNCFCKASAYRARFWADAPAVLFERKMIVAMRDTASAENPPPSAVTRPLVALMENDEAVQLLVKTIVTTLGYGFIAGGNAEEAEGMVREYLPDLILADAWTPNRDGREVCRLLKEEPALAQVKTVVMTGRFADRNYRHEALSQFNVDDCIPKPLAAGDLLEIVKKHLPRRPADDGKPNYG